MADLVERLRSWKQVRTTPYPIGYYLDAGIKAADEIERLTALTETLHADQARARAIWTEEANARDAEIKRLRAEVAALNQPVKLSEWQELVAERDRLSAEVAAKEKFVKDAIAACSNAGRLRELLRESKEWMDDYFRSTPEGRDLCDRIDAALGGEKS